MPRVVLSKINNLMAVFTVLNGTKFSKVQLIKRKWNIICNQVLIIFCELLCTIDRNLSTVSKTQEFHSKLLGFWNSWTKYSNYNLGQNIRYKIMKSSKTGLEKKSLISIFACFLTAIAKVWFVVRRLGMC